MTTTSFDEEFEEKGRNNRKIGLRNISRDAKREEERDRKEAQERRPGMATLFGRRRAVRAAYNSILYYYTAKTSLLSLSRSCSYRNLQVENSRTRSEKTEAEIHREDEEMLGRVASSQRTGLARTGVVRSRPTQRCVIDGA